MPRFLQKMILYWWTRFGTLTPWRNIPGSRIFHWRFWQTSKQTYKKLEYKVKPFQMFQGFCRLTRKIVLSSSIKFSILKPWTDIQSVRRLDLGFLQASKQTDRKLQYIGEICGKFKVLPHFPIKMVLYSSTKLGILKSWTNIQSLRRFDWGFWLTLKQIYRKRSCKQKVFEEF